jgi:8-oxo-dGTP diphosphatase
MTDNTRKKPAFCLVCGARLGREWIEDRERDVCPECRWVHYDNPLPCAAALVRNAANEVLLVKRGVEPGLGLWGLPSGFMEIDETPEQACLRELKEETGLEGRILKLMGVYAQDSVRYKKVVIIGYAVKAEGTPRPGSDTTETRYFPQRRLPEIAFSSHQAMIEEGFAGGGK